MINGLRVTIFKFLLFYNPHSEICNPKCVDSDSCFLNLGIGIYSEFFKFSLRTLRLCGEKHVFNLSI